MGLCEGLGAIYSGSCRESALLIVRAKGEWKMCLPLLPRRRGRGLLCWRHPGLVLAPTQAAQQGPLLSGQQLSQGSEAYLGLQAPEFLHTSPVIAVYGSGGPRTTRLSGEIGKSCVTEISLPCAHPVWQSRCHSLHFWKLKQGSWQ